MGFIGSTCTPPARVPASPLHASPLMYRRKLKFKAKVESSSSYSSFKSINQARSSFHTAFKRGQPAPPSLDGARSPVTMDPAMEVNTAM